MGSQAAAVGMALVGLLVGAGYGFKVSHGLRLSTQVRRPCGFREN